MIPILILFMMIASCSSEIDPCPSRWNYIPRLHVCLQIPTYPMTWEESQSHCEAANGTLAIINSESEYAIIRSMVAKENPKFLTWVGLRADDEGSFRWKNDEELQFSRHWLPGHPDLSVGSCVSLQSSDHKHGFKSLSCEHKQFFLCEKKARGCDPVHLNSSSGFVDSPNWPEQYPVDLNCFYFVEVPLGRRIKLKFVNIDTVEGEDVLTIYDGVGEEAPTLGKVSGQRFGRNLLSKSHTISFHFVTTSNSPQTGFRIKFEEWSEPEPIVIDSSSDEDGKLTSEGYPNGYNFTHQRYLLKCPENRAILLTISDVNLHGADILSVHQYGSQQKFLKRLQGIVHELPIVFEVQSGEILLKFSGFNGKNHAGWSAHHRCVAKEIEIP